ncbi:hypothetical protein VTJ04DRAFT_10435 [Mycothermus thermophilus]|uniref:uncharacterized protein n=1 Tax=Humicola insolens TaxID=85995 RepID=UPI0037429266
MPDNDPLAELTREVQNNPLVPKLPEYFSEMAENLRRFALANERVSGESSSATSWHRIVKIDKAEQVFLSAVKHYEPDPPLDDQGSLFLAKAMGDTLIRWETQLVLEHVKPLMDRVEVYCYGEHNLSKNASVAEFACEKLSEVLDILEDIIKALYLHHQRRFPGWNYTYPEEVSAA